MTTVSSRSAAQAAMGAGSDSEVAREVAAFEEIAAQVDDSDVEPKVPHRIEIHLDSILVQRGLSVGELSDLTGITRPNLNILRYNRARAIRFTTLTLICDALACTPQDLTSIQETPALSDASLQRQEPLS